MKQSDGGICGYVAINMLILYNEFFQSSGYYSKWESENFLKVSNNNFYESSNLKMNLNSSIIPRLNSSFLKYLYQKTWFGDGVNYWWHAKYIAESLLYNKWKESKINYSYWGDYALGQPWNTIVNYNRPTALGGSYTGVSNEDPEYKKLWEGGHVVVAYGAYDDGRFLCNYGWDLDYSQMVIRKYHQYNDYNFVINNKSNGKLEKLFNFNGVRYNGKDIDKLLKEKGYIK